MPALITHYLFGEEALNRGLFPTPEGFGASPRPGARDEELRQAFCLGCQGPDPFFFAVTTPRGAIVRSMGGAMHRERMTDAFDELRLGWTRLPEDARAAGQAFAAGMLAHYALDRVAHPYVYTHEFELCDDNPELGDAYHEVHALIESEVDCGMLDAYRGRSVAGFAPAGVLEASDKVVQVAGALLADVARAVFRIPLRPTDYARALEDMRLCYRAIEPYESGRTRALGLLERGLRPHSQLMALAHRVELGAGNASMNPGRLPWRDPFKTGDDGAPLVSTEGFAEVFERALSGYPRLVRTFLGGEPMGPAVERLDYSGRRLGADELALPEDEGHPL